MNRREFLRRAASLAPALIVVPAAVSYFLPPKEGWPPLRLDNMRRIADLMGKIWCPESFEDMKDQMQLTRSGEEVYLLNPDYVRIYLQPFRGSLGVNITTRVDPDLEDFRRELEESRDWHRRYATRHMSPEARKEMFGKEKWFRG